MRFFIMLIGNICLVRLLVEDFNNPLIWVVFITSGLLYVTGELE